LETVAIIGVGLLGGSLGLDVKARGLARRVIGLTRREETAREILAHGAADEATTDWSALAGAEMVVLAAPVSAIIAGMADVARNARPDAIVTDMGSTKAEIVRAGELCLGGRFVGGHPMAGSHESGVSAARENLFEGATWVLTPTERTDPAAVEKVNALALALGAQTVCLDIDHHDRIAAAVSHMPHVAAAALTLAVRDLAEGDPRFSDLAAGGLRDMTRLAASPPNVWRDILSTNRANTKEALAALRAALDAAIAAMDDDDRIEALFAGAGLARTTLVRNK
jgi:prephenate dehydrogenase